VAHRVVNQLDGGKNRADLHHEHHGFFALLVGSVSRRVAYGTEQQLSVRQRFRFECEMPFHDFRKLSQANISKCSRIGPRVKAGKNVRAPTIAIVDTNT